VAGLEARELVSTFGHGRHSCPAQRFSISAIRIALRRLLDRYDLSPLFRRAGRCARKSAASHALTRAASSTAGEPLTARTKRSSQKPIQ
jgi:hypothetical protein